jgi:hypothetical protein
MSNNEKIVSISKIQLFAIIAMSAISLVAIVVGVISGIEDRAIIKIRVNDVLSNISQGERLQTKTLDEIEQFENESEQRSQRLLPPFERFINASERMTNATFEMLNKTEHMERFIDFIGSSFDEEYLIDEVRQYEQSNTTNATLPKIIELLRDVNSSLSR